jgi:hypothetical protein
LALKVTVAVPTECPCWAMMKLPDWGIACSGATDRSAIRANLRKTVFTFYPVRHEIKGKSCEKQLSVISDQLSAGGFNRNLPSQAEQGRDHPE